MQSTSPSPHPPLSSPVDILLADVAIRIQLSQSDYDRAVARYMAINRWIEREGSPLKDRVDLFYAQGSMATGSTIASKLQSDEYDIDIIAQLTLPADVTPQEALDLLYAAIRGERGSRYYHMAKRRTRCVTVDYSNAMHLDVTPMLRRNGTPERESWLFHHRAEAPHEPSYRCIANPYGFAEWFKENTPLDHDFAKAFEERAREYEKGMLVEMAETDPVLPQEPPFRKSKAVLALQLLKRWRNIRYDGRHGRRPPSIMIAKLLVDGANSTDSLSEELLHQARLMLSEFQRWQNDGALICVANPVCSQDVLTDRWPSSLPEQGVFVNDLRALVSKVERLVSGCALDEMQSIMIDLFGEAPTTETFRVFNQRQGREVRRGRSQHVPGAGHLVVPSVVVGGTSMVEPSVRPTKKHTFYGGKQLG